MLPPSVCWCWDDLKTERENIEALIGDLHERIKVVTNGNSQMRMSLRGEVVAQGDTTNIMYNPQTVLEEKRQKNLITRELALRQLSAEGSPAICNYRLMQHLEAEAVAKDLLKKFFFAAGFRKSRGLLLCRASNPLHLAY